MKKTVLVMSLLLSVLLLGNAKVVRADDKPPHYGDWDVVYDKVLKKTTLIHQHRPYGEHVPGMGDSFSVHDFQLEYSLEAIISGVGTPNFKVVYYWLFDNPLERNAAFVLSVPTRFFKYSSATQFTLLIDDQSATYPVENYHTGQFGDEFIGHFPYEEFRVPLSQDTLAKLLVAKEVAGNLSSDDQNASKSFMFDQSFKEVVRALVYRVSEIKNGTFPATGK